MNIYKSKIPLYKFTSFPEYSNSANIVWIELVKTKNELDFQLLYAYVSD